MTQPRYEHQLPWVTFTDWLLRRGCRGRLSRRAARFGRWGRCELRPHVGTAHALEWGMEVLRFCDPELVLLPGQVARVDQAQWIEPTDCVRVSSP